MPSNIKEIIPYNVFSRSFFRYLIAGGLAFATEYSAFILLNTLFSTRVILYHILSFLLGLLVSYALNRQWAFRSKRFAKKAKDQMIAYFSLAIFNLIFTTVLIYALTSVGLLPLISKLIVMLGVVLWNFIIFRYFIFKEEKFSN